jgi:TnpA family transposase
LPDQRLWRLTDSAPYQHIEAAVSNKLNVNLIRDTWDEMLRLAASLKYGDEKASLIVGVALPFTKIFTLRVTKMYPAM